MNPTVEQLIVNRVAVPVEAPGRIKVHPWGLAKSTSGESIVDADAVAAILAAFAEHRVDLPIDYEHQTLGGEYAAPNGQAPAAGWIKSLEAVPGDGLYANVEWTKAGAAAIAEKEYRYLSPVLLVRKDDRRVIKLHSVALTNKPAIAGMAPIVNKEFVAMSEDLLERCRWFLNLPTTARETEIMNEFEKLMSQLREMAGVAANTDQQGVLAALKEKLKPQASGLKPLVCKALKLAEDAKDDEVVAAVNKAVEKPAEVDPTKYVPMTEFVALKDRQAKSDAQLLAINRDKFIAGGLKEGRICTANKEAWEKRFNANPEDAAEALKLVPEGTYPVDGRVVNKDGAPAGATDRVTVINKAKAQYDAEATLQALTTKEAFVKDQLEQAKLSRTLSDEEKKLVA